MPSDESKNPLLQCFRRKLHLAVQLTQDDYRREAKQGEDPAAILARMKPLVHANFKPVAQIAAQLIAAGFAWEVEEVHGTTGWVISDLKTNPYPVNVLHEYEFQDMFTDVWCRLVIEAELEAPSPSQPPTQTVRGDAQTRALASESKSVVEEEESPEDRQRRRIILAAVKLKLKGLKYAEYLHVNGLRPSLRLQADGGPSTYTGGYKKFKKSFWKEKTRIVNESTRKSSTKPPTIH
jgi:hypothetical protein